MSGSRPARCLFSGPSIPTIRPRIRCRNFHASPNVCVRQKPKNIKASAMGLMHKDAEEIFKRYSAEEKDVLATKYTPEQMRAIDLGEKAIDPKDLKKRGVVRTDLGALPYFDDFSQTRPVLDRAQDYDGPIDPRMRLMTEEEALRAEKDAFKPYLKRWLEEKRQGYVPNLRRNGASQPTHDILSRTELMKVDDQVSYFMGTNGPIPRAHTTSYMAPALPKKFLDVGEDIKEPTTQEKEAKMTEEEDTRDPDGLYNRLMKQTGLTLDDIFNYKVKILVKHRVVNQTRLGKIQSMYCLAIAGNGNGMLGVGEAKGQEIEDTQSNAKIAAIRNMQPIPRYEERTIFGDVESKVSAVEVKLMARPPGFGLRCQHLIFEMARAAGIQDLAARVPRSRNKMNTVKAAYQALMRQRIPDEVAMGLGKKLVDVRKVYYGGRV